MIFYAIRFVIMFRFFLKQTVIHNNLGHIISMKYYNNYSYKINPIFLLKAQFTIQLLSIQH